MNKLDIILIFPVYKGRFSQHEMAGCAWAQPAVWGVGVTRREPSIPDVLHSSQDASLAL